jgi:hypothetical protein
VSISSTFFARVFCTKDNSATFSSYILALVKGFWRKKALSYEKSVQKMLMKLTLGFEIFWRKNMCAKVAHENVDEIETYFVPYLWHPHLLFFSMHC